MVWIQPRLLTSWCHDKVPDAFSLCLLDKRELGVRCEKVVRDKELKLEVKPSHTRWIGERGYLEREVDRDERLSSSILRFIRRV